MFDVLQWKKCSHSHFMAVYNDKMELKINAINEFLEENKGERIFIFGFTYIIYQHFHKELDRLNIKLDLSNSVMIHGGGWKKLVDQSVSNDKFKLSLKKQFGISNIYNYYGMMEQTGSVFLECEKGYFHCSIFSDIFIRNSKLKPSKIKETGLIQTLSLLPLSYPGHNILTEDMGIIHGIDNCKCGKKGKYFLVSGRMKQSEIRGCSDV